MLERFLVPAGGVEQVRDVVLDSRLEMPIADPATRGDRLLPAFERAVDIARRRDGQGQAGERGDGCRGVSVGGGGRDGDFEMRDRGPPVPGIKRDEARHAARGTDRYRVAGSLGRDLRLRRCLCRASPVARPAADHGAISEARRLPGRLARAGKGRVEVRVCRGQVACPQVGAC